MTEPFHLYGRGLWGALEEGAHYEPLPQHGAFEAAA